MSVTGLDTLEVEDNVEAFMALAAERGWGDGLPLVLPTQDRVAAMLRYAPRSPEDSLGAVPPGNGEATLGALAANAVMAGCRPEYFPVICAAVDALLDPVFNLYGLQATTNPGAPLVLLNGPIAAEIGVNARGNVFGQGWQANATIGRAIRLILLNVGGGHPQTVDRATHGFPGKFTLCGAENEQDSPWPPFSVDRGLQPDESAVTVLSVQGFHNIVDFTSTSARDVLLSLAAGMSAWGTNDMTHGGQPALVLAPEHADIIARDGWGKSDVSRFLYEHARFDLHLLADGMRERMLTRRPMWINERSYPLVDSPDDILILVAGGPGSHALFLPSFGASLAVTRRIEFSDGTPASSVGDFLERADRS